MNKKGLIGGIGAGVCIIIAIVLLIFCSVRVPAGYVAVQYDMNGGVRDEVLTQGWHIVSPTVHTTLYTVGIEQSYLTKGDKGDSEKNERFSASTKESKSINIDLTFTYQYNPEDVVGVFKRFKGQSGKDVRDSFIKPNIVSWSKEIIAKYKVTEILGERRAKVNEDLSNSLAKKFEPYGITISNVSIIDGFVDKNTQAAIDKKIQAEQDAETQKIKNQTAIDKAEAEAKVAEINAEKTVTAAKAEAEANELRQKTITKELIEYEKIQKWDGKLPQVSGSNAIVDLK